MKRIAIEEISAFTVMGKGGNRAGVVLHADQLQAHTMQDIAKKVGYSETAFVSGDENVGFSMRYFDPATEVDLCGHATIAAWAAIQNEYRLGHGTYSHQTNVGKINVEITDNLIFMTQNEPTFGDFVPVQELADTLGINEDRFANACKPQVVSTGLSTILVEVKNQKTLADLRPDRGKMLGLCSRYGAILVHPFTLNKRPGYLADVRNFGPSLGVFEDAATGTSNAALLHYLGKNGRISNNNETMQTYRIEQGAYINCPSCIYGKITNGNVVVGGETTLINSFEI